MTRLRSLTQHTTHSAWGSARDAPTVNQASEKGISLCWFWFCSLDSTKEPRLRFCAFVIRSDSSTKEASDWR